MNRDTLAASLLPRFAGRIAPEAAVAHCFKLADVFMKEWAKLPPAPQAPASTPAPAPEPTSSQWGALSELQERMSRMRAEQAAELARLRQDVAALATATSTALARGSEESRLQRERIEKLESDVAALRALIPQSGKVK